MSSPSNPSPYAFTVGDRVLFDPTSKQLEFLQAQETNVFVYGNRGSGKSITARMLCHAKALAHPGLIYIVVRRSFPELTKNHLIFLGEELETFGGSYNKTEHQCYYANGSVGFYAQCASDGDVRKVVGAEAALVIFDEAPELEFEWLRLIAGSIRVKKGSGLNPMVRYLGNPIGPSIDQLWQYCIDKDVDPLQDPEYRPQDWRAIELRLEDNPYLDAEIYKRQFAGIPPHIKKAWLDGIRVIEGAYFVIDPKRHFTSDYVHLGAHVDPHTGIVQPAPRIYRAVDFGTHDNAVCLWIALYANGRAIVFKELDWTYTTAKKIAEDIKAASQGMRIVETFADPTMFPPEGSDLVYAGNIFESNGIPLTKSRNDRTACGFGISEWFYTDLADGLPKLQLHTNCRLLVKTLPNMRSDPKQPCRIADSSKDHWTVTLGYFCMAFSAAPSVVTQGPTPTRMSHVIAAARNESDSRRRLGSESVRRHR